ncbi:hypothetical protein [Ornithinimicrobium cerasi]|uniref:Secreted protein n=1 Tax=Ornithinimicrobium cerasi TaxID=2248773 RepID=A0A285VLT9_9MICO|nr:hypothetical protein [Ornithinimicrobium cerasi]SOC53541.1 hypothetical protein SAMN05421879_10216 [Ornithinimicrobium cerasi]
MRSSRVRRTTAAFGAAAMMALGAAGTASGAPAMRLPEADLWCEGDLVATTTEWVALPKAGTLWIEEGPMVGHYVILASGHIGMPGHLYEVPEGDLGMDRSFGRKAGPAEESLSCVVLSRWDTPDGPFTVVGPLTVARVSG